MGFRVSVSLHPAIQATGRLTFAPAGLIPAEHTSLRWTHVVDPKNDSSVSPATGEPQRAHSHSTSSAGLISNPAVELALCFLHLPNFALDRLNRYEAALWRQVGQTLL